MKTVSVLLLFFFFFLVMAEATTEGSCEHFTCGELDFKFPFYRTNMSSRCGLFKLNCSADVTEIQLVEGGKWYKVKSVSQTNTITVTDPRLNESLTTGNCNDLSSFSLPDSPWLELSTLYKCNNSNGFTYTNCRGRGSYYSDMGNDQDRSGCSVIKTPKSWLDRINKNQTVINGTFFLHINIPGACFRCQNRGGECKKYKEEYRCVGATTEQNINHEVIKLGLGIGGFVILIIILVAIVCRFFRRRKASGFGESKEGPFSYEELVIATNGFSDENILGEGGFGRVYKGVLQDERVVAVKQLKLGGGQGDREFKAEIETLSMVHHRNLLSMVGYCIFKNKKLLIYDYVSNNNLYFHLHYGTPSLDWATRVKIAVGTACGLAYLHEDCHPRIIHRDIKSSNILLEDDFHALISDFGLAKLVLDCSNSHVSTRVMGTFGYMAPEYATSGKLTEKSDVFSFGVVILELITGRKAVDTSQPLGDESLVEWARPLLTHAIETNVFTALADPKLGQNYVGSEMFTMVEAAAACIRHSAAKRPRMSQIVRAFNSLVEEDLTNGMRPGESEIINFSQQSEEIRLFTEMAFGRQNYSTDSC